MEKKLKQPPTDLLQNGRIEEWNTWIAKQSRVVIEDLDLSEKTIEGANFTVPAKADASTSRANRSGVWLRRVNFTGAKLKNVSFVGAWFRNVRFERSELNCVAFDHVAASQGQASFENVLFKNACHFKHASMSEVSFNGAEMHRSNFAFADLYETNFSGCDIGECVFESIQAGHSKWIGGQVNKSRFLGADLPSAEFANATLEDVIFDEANLTASQWNQATSTSCSFIRSIWNDANAYESRFNNCSFKEADFRRFTIRKSKMIECKLDGIWVYDWRPEELLIIRPTLTSAILDNNPDIDKVTLQPVPTNFETPEAFYKAVSEKIRERDPDVDDSRSFVLGEPLAVCFTHKTRRKPWILMTEDEVDEIVAREKEFEHFMVRYKEKSWVSKKKGRNQQPQVEFTPSEAEIFFEYLKLYEENAGPIKPARTRCLVGSTGDAKRKQFTNMRAKIDGIAKRNKEEEYRLFEFRRAILEEHQDYEYWFSPENSVSYCFIIEAKYYLTV